jgi:hypothetical protein
MSDVDWLKEADELLARLPEPVEVVEPPTVRTAFDQQAYERIETASGSMLDSIASANFDFVRHVGETDDALRMRIKLMLNPFTGFKGHEE